MTFEAGLFDRKQVLVTGTAGGIGASVADLFHDLGAEVTAADLTDVTGRLAETSSVRHATLDVTDQADVDCLFGTLSHLDILVNCAGIISRGREHHIDAFDRTLAVNLSGTMRMCSAARPKLAAKGGSIINMASMLSLFGSGVAPGYSASKGGVSQLTKSLAIAYASDGIRVNAVAPGWISTPLTAPLRNDDDASHAVLARTPLARWGSPDDVANAVVFLASQAASFITGSILTVDGGYSAR